MSAIRVLRTRRENTVQQRDATLPGGDLDPGPGAHLDQNVLDQLRRGNLSLDSEPLWALPRVHVWRYSCGLECRSPVIEIKSNKLMRQPPRFAQR